jgi:hypothetical protein
VDGSTGAAPNVPIARTGEIQQAPTLAVDPTNSRHLVAAYLDAPFSGAYTGLSVSQSTDGGATWSERTPLALPAGFDQAAAAPTVVFDAAGGVHISFMAVTYLGEQPILPNPDSNQRLFGFTSNNGIFVVSSDDGGTTWGPARAVVSHTFPGDPVVATVQPGAAGSPEIQTVRVLGTDGGFTLKFRGASTSLLAGASATAVQNALSALIPIAGDPKVVGDEGSVTVTASGSAGDVTYTITFGGTLASADMDQITATFAVPFETFPSMAVDTSPKLADGVTANPNFGNLYVAWSRFYPPGQFPKQAASTSGSDVFVAVSSDGGQNWTTQLRTTGANAGRSVILDARYFNNGTGGVGRGFVTFPTVTVGAGGDVYVSTYAGGEFTVYHSSNGARSFTPPDYNSQTGLPFPTLGGIIVPSPSLQTNAYLGAPGTRTLPLRQIVADPAHAGRLYAVAVSAVSAVTARVGPQAGQVIDPGDVIFARSDDFGQTWTSNFTILKQPSAADRLTPAQIASYVPTLNDDNAGDQAALVEDLSTQVLAGQALPSLAVDANGNVVVVWYDTRVGPFAPNNPNTPISNALTVWGTVSTDGGRTFSPNFQISDTAFDPFNGRFAAGDRATVATYPGDQISVVIANGTAYVAWSDARAGRTPATGTSGPLRRQDIYLGKFSLFPNPSAPVDRFGGNNTFETPTDLTALGYTTVTLDLAKLVLSPGRADKWFVLQAGANGPLTAVATGVRPGDLHLEITDESGAVLPATLTPVTDANGTVIGTKVTVAAAAGSFYFVHAYGTNDNALSFNLSLTNLTADLGPQVQGSVTAAVAGQDVYRLVAGVNGTLNLKLDGDGSQGLVVLTPDGVTPLFDGIAAGANKTSLRVTQGQTVLILAIDLAGTGANYTLSFTNTDQYVPAPPKPNAPPEPTTLFLPTTGTPASVALGDFNRDGIADLIATTTDRADVVSAFLGNGDGTFQAPRLYDAGAGLRGTLTADNRQPGVADVNRDGFDDLVVPNFRAADMSVYLNRGDGTFLPQRRVDAVTSPDFTAVGDFNGDGNPDLVVLQNFPQLGSVSQFSVLIGNGDGLFAPAVSYRTAFTNGAGPVLTGDFTGDGKMDLLVFSKNTPLGQLFRGNGDGTFTEAGTFAAPENAFSVQAAELDGDGKLDLIFAGTNSGNVYTALGNGDGTFQPAQKYTVMIAGPGDNVGVRSVALIDYDPANSPLLLTAPPQDIFGVQLDYGSRALVMTAASRSGQGAAEVILLPELVDPAGHFAGFSPTPVTVAKLKQAGNLTIGDFDGDGKSEVAVADVGGVSVVYGFSAAPPTVPANSTRTTARDLATVTHYVTPALSIVDGRSDSYFKFTVPTEAAAGSGDQVIDISAAFQYQSGPGLQMEVLDAAGNVLATGSRIRLVAAQGAVLYVHVFGPTAGTTRGAGAYAIDITVLPQVVSAQAQTLLPGGPATQIVLTLQGDRLDPSAAEDPANFTVTWHGPGDAGDPGRVGWRRAAGGVQPWRQRRRVERGDVPDRRSADHHAPVLRTAAGRVVHDCRVLRRAGGAILPGRTGRAERRGVVRRAPAGVGGRRRDPERGRPRRGQPRRGQRRAGQPQPVRHRHQLPHPDAQRPRCAARPTPPRTGRRPDDHPGHHGADPRPHPPRAGPVRHAGSAGHLARPGVDQPGRLGGGRTVYNEGAPTVAGGLRNAFVEVGGNVELVVIAGAQGTFTLNVGDVGGAVRGGAVVINGASPQTVGLMDALRGGTSQFQFSLNGAVPGQPGLGTEPVGTPGPGGTPITANSAGTTASGGTASVSAILTTALLGEADLGAAGAPTLGTNGGAVGGASSPAPSTGGSTLVAGSGSTGSPISAGVIQAALSEFSRDLARGTTPAALAEAVRATLRRLVRTAPAAKGGIQGALPPAPADGGDPAAAAAAPADKPAPAPDGLPTAPAPREKNPQPVLEGQVGAADPEPTPLAEPDDERRLAGGGLATIVASLLAASVAETRRPGSRRGRATRLDDLPHADLP